MRIREYERRKLPPESNEPASPEAYRFARTVIEMLERHPETAEVEPRPRDVDDLILTIRKLKVKVGVALHVDKGYKGTVYCALEDAGYTLISITNQHAHYSSGSGLNNVDYNLRCCPWDYQDFYRDLCRELSAQGFECKNQCEEGQPWN